MKKYWQCKGTVYVTMIFEPLAGQRDAVVDETRAAIDFANILRHTTDDLYPDAEKILLVLDNPNTHTLPPHCKAFPPEEAHRLANRFELHYTPVYGSWLDMAESEIGIMCR